jgi:hypothetical protein
LAGLSWQSSYLTQGGITTGPWVFRWSTNLNAPEKEIKTTDFDITREQSLTLFANGGDSARNYLKDCDFDRWKDEYSKRPW